MPEKQARLDRRGTPRVAFCRLDPAKRWVSRAAAVALLFAPGCIQESQRSSEEGALIVPAESVQVVGTAESLARVVDLHPGADGKVWVLNMGAPYVLSFGEDGSVVSSAGRQGQGPGEFRSPAGIVAGPSADDVWVYEDARNALVRVSGPEAEWRELVLARDSAERFRPVALDNIGIGFGRPWLVKLAGAFVLARSRPPASVAQCVSGRRTCSG
jgi:hypothetical protein